MSSQSHRGAMLSTRQRVALSVGVVIAGVAALSSGTYALFTGSTEADATFASGTVALAPIGTSGAANRLSVGASGLAAGDSVERAVNVRNNGTIDMSTVTLTTSADPSSLLDTDDTDGLQLAIDRCSVPWDEAGPPYTYTCSGSTSSTLSSRQVIGTDLALNGLGLTAGANNYLRVRLTLPSGAPDTFQDQSSTITFAFTGTQRSGASR